MKATIKFNGQNGNSRQATIAIEKDEPNAIIRKAVEMKKIKKYDTVKTIKCGRRVYQWYGSAVDAF